MKKILVILFAVLVFAACSTKSGEISTASFAGAICKYQYGNITYLLFDKGNGGVAVVNYTSDSLEYEFLKHPTKEDSSVVTSYGGSFNVKTSTHDPDKAQ